MPRAVLYMPFDPKNIRIARTRTEYGGTGTFKKNEKVISHLKSKGYDACEVWYDGGQNPHILSLDVGQIYIRGHGDAGDPTIEGGRGGERIKFVKVAERLIESGLKNTFGGEIHCYNCHSGESGSGKVSTRKKSYARMLADFLYTAGYRSCKYYGYLGAIDSFAKDGSKGTTMYARGNIGPTGRTALYGTPTAQSQAEMGTMAQARVGIHPTVDLVTKTQKFWSFFKH